MFLARQRGDPHPRPLLALDFILTPGGGEQAVLDLRGRGLTPSPRVRPAERGANPEQGTCDCIFLISKHHQEPIEVCTALQYFNDFMN